MPYQNRKPQFRASPKPVCGLEFENANRLIKIRVVGKCKSCPGGEIEANRVSARHATTAPVPLCHSLRFAESTTFPPRRSTNLNLLQILEHGSTGKKSRLRSSGGRDPDQHRSGRQFRMCHQSGIGSFVRCREKSIVPWPTESASFRAVPDAPMLDVLSRLQSRHCRG
jgi:hypothetical protein